MGELLARLKREAPTWETFREKPKELRLSLLANSYPVNGVVLLRTKLSVLCGKEGCLRTLGEINVTATPTPVELVGSLATHSLDVYFQPPRGFFPERPATTADGYDRPMKYNTGGDEVDIDIPAKQAILSASPLAQENPRNSRWSKRGRRRGTTNIFIEHYPVRVRCSGCNRVNIVNRQLLDGGKRWATQTLEGYELPRLVFAVGEGRLADASLTEVQRLGYNSRE